MTNRKLKPGNLQPNMKGRAAFRETGRNLMTFYLGLKAAGLSLPKIKKLDRTIIMQEVAKFRKDSHDGVIDNKVEKFLKSVDIPRARFDAFVLAYNVPHIKGTFNQIEYDVVVDGLAVDLAVYCLLVNKYHGFGHIRLDRVLTFMENYKGDCFAECKELFGFEYGDEYEVPDMSRFNREKVKMSRSELKTKQTELDAVRKIQGKVTA